MHTNIAARLRVANEFLVIGRNADVRRLVLDVLSEEPENWFALSLLARSLSGLGEHPAAVEAARRSVSLAPESCDAQWQSGLVFLRAGDAQTAQASFERAVAISPNHATSHVFLAKAFSTLGLPVQALQEIDLALALDPSNAEAWATRSMFLSSPTRAAESRAAAREALRLAPHAARSHIASGYSALVSDNAAQAVDDFREGLRLNPDSVLTQRAYVTAWRKRLPVARLFATMNWSNFMFLVFFLSLCGSPKVMLAGAVALVLVAAANTSATPNLTWIILGALIATSAVHGWAFSVRTALIAVAATLVVFGAADLVTALIISRDRLVRHTLTSTYRRRALWFVANLALAAIFAVVGIARFNGGMFWIAETCASAAALVAIYGRNLDAPDESMLKIVRIALRWTAIAQVCNLLAGAMLIFSLTPYVPGQIVPYRVYFPPPTGLIFLFPLAFVFLINAFVLALYLLKLSTKAMKENTQRMKARRMRNVQR